MNAQETFSRENFSRNMSVLEKAYPLLAEELHRAESGADGGRKATLQIEAAASGVPTLVIFTEDAPGVSRGVYIHSKRDPEREAERLVESAANTAAGGALGASSGSAPGATLAASGLDGGEGPALVLGFGLGYTAEALAARFPERPVIIVEKRPGVLKKALEARDLSAFLSGNRLVFVLGGDGGGVTGALSLFESSPGVPPLVVRNRALAGLDEEWYAGVEERIQTWNMRTTVNHATKRRFGTRWVRNLSRNMEAGRDIPGISALEGLLAGTGIPVFLAAAGPGLDEAASLLDAAYRRCLVIAVDTSLRFLLDRGTEPDFAVSVDPQYWNFRHLDRQNARKTRLVAESAVYPPVLRHPFGGIFFCGSFFPLGRFIEDRLEPKGDLGAGGSVATSAWDFARILGAETVWLAGLDLSFPGLRTHFKGARFEEKSLAESGRFFPAETWNFHALRDGQPFRAKKNGGGSVLTDKRLSLYAAWFENRFGQFPRIKNLSLSSGGLAINGLETGTPEAFLSLPERREEIEKLLSGAFGAVKEGFGSEKAGKLREEKYKNARNALLDGLEEVQNLALDAATHAENAAARNKLGHLDEKQREKTLARLDAANKSVTKSAVREITGFLFPETTGWEAEIALKTRDNLARYLEFSARFYRALAASAGDTLGILRK